MSSRPLATRIRENLASSDSRAKLVASLIASVLASVEVPLLISVDDALTLHGYDLKKDSDLGVEVAMRIDAFRHSLDRKAAELILARAKEDDHFAISVANEIALAAPVETDKGYAFAPKAMAKIKAASPR